jgi:hypothetical protein
MTSLIFKIIRANYEGVLISCACYSCTVISRPKHEGQENYRMVLQVRCTLHCYFIQQMVVISNILHPWVS